MTPFDHWWAIFASPRKKNKEKCRLKFEAHDLETQRHIYRHTQWALRNHPDWRLEGGIRPYMQGPEPYLNQQPWTDWDPEPPSQAVAITPNHAEAAHLAALERLANAAGEDGKKIAGQIQELRDKMGATVVNVDAALSQEDKAND